MAFEVRARAETPPSFESKAVAIERATLGRAPSRDGVPRDRYHSFATVLARPGRFHSWATSWREQLAGRNCDALVS